MKKTSAKLFALILASVMLVCVLASCGKKVTAGSYTAELEILGQSAGVTYTFKGNKVEAESKVEILGFENSKTAEGTYEIVKDDDGDLEIKIDFEDETDIFKDGTYSFSEGDDYIKIAGVKYEKAE